jgi:hypothetical protein
MAKIGRLFRDLRKANLTLAGVIRQWRYFDAAFYRARYPEVVAAGMHPFLHYLLHGGAEGRKPCAWFDPVYYLAGSKDARKRGGNPFLDYLQHGRQEQASPHPLVDGKALSGPPREGSLFGSGRM